MLTFFWIVGGIGILLLLVSLFGFGGDHEFDHDFDHDGIPDSGDAGPSLFSYKVIISFLAAFGIGGALAMQLGNFSPFWSSITGVGAGIISGFVVWGFLKIAFSQQASSTISLNDCIGLSGVVTIPIYPGTTGEISVVIKGQSKCFMAITSVNKVIPEGATVKIVEANASILKVEAV